MAVYLLACEGSSLVKIGWAENPEERCAMLGRMSAHPTTMLWTTGPEHGKGTEAKLHRIFRARQRHGEWFEFDGEDAVALVGDAVRSIEEAEARRKAPPAPPRIINLTYAQSLAWASS